MNFFKWHLKKQKSNIVTDETVELMNKIITNLDEEINNLYESYNFSFGKYGINNLPVVLNSIIFFRTNFKDIVLLTKQMISEKDEQQENLNARDVALDLYEFLDHNKDFLPSI
jgi:hypothetical protein